MIERITMIGAGNLAVSLAQALQHAGIRIVQVYSRTEESAGALGRRLNVPYTHVPEKTDLKSDLILVAVKDDAIVPVLERLPIGEQIVAHTAGSVPLHILKRYSRNYGVIYPLQTFSRNRTIDFSAIPLCLEAGTPAVMEELEGLARKLSASVSAVNSEKRKYLHLSAVFACNFVNHFYYLAHQLLMDQQLSFDLLKPLIGETAGKVLYLNPREAQTGPARRYDRGIIGKHLELLENKPEFRKMYELVTDSIYQAHKNESNDLH